MASAPPSTGLYPKATRALLNAVVDSGINVIDAAYDYANGESIIGEFLSHRHSGFHLATKCGCTESGRWPLAAVAGIMSSLPIEEGMVPISSAPSKNYSSWVWRQIRGMFHSCGGRYGNTLRRITRSGWYGEKLPLPRNGWTHRGRGAVRNDLGKARKQGLIDHDEPDRLLETTEWDTG